LADLYDAIKAAFDAEDTLVSSPFDKLHAGEVGSPTDVAMPYCSMTVPQENILDECFGGRDFVEETFAFHVVDKTRELCRAHAKLVNAVFNSRSLSLSADGIDAITMKKTGQTEEQADEDCWLCSIDYQATYWRQRPS